MSDLRTTSSFAKSLADVEAMTALLVEEFTRAGLAVNGTKTKLLTTDAEASSGPAPMMVDIAGMFVELVRRGSSHKYLGKTLPGDLRTRGQRNLDHRLSCAWLKFHQLQLTLLNRKIPVHLRLKLFDSVVSPTALYSLSTTPLTETQLQKLDGAQRKMLRKIVGWVRYEDEEWNITGSRMKQRLDAALTRRPVADWSAARDNQRARLIRKATREETTGIVCRVFSWALRPTLPAFITYRRRGRPACRWTDGAPVALFS